MNNNQQTNKNIDIVKSYFTAVQTGDMQTLAALVSPEIIWHQPGNNVFSGTHETAQEVFAMIGGMMEKSKGTFKIDHVDAVMGNENQVCAMLTFSAQSDGTKISMKGVDTMIIKNGLIVEAWLYSEDQEAEDAFWGK